MGKFHDFNIEICGILNDMKANLRNPCLLYSYLFLTTFLFPVFAACFGLFVIFVGPYAACDEWDFLRELRAEYNHQTRYGSLCAKIIYFVFSGVMHILTYLGVFIVAAVVVSALYALLIIPLWGCSFYMGFKISYRWRRSTARERRQKDL
jgi:hypothetical protein